MYGEDGIGEVKVTRGKEHSKLGMKLIYTREGEWYIDMQDYVEEIVRKFPEDLQGSANTPWKDQLFKVDKKDIELNKEFQKEFYSQVMKCMFFCKESWPDIEPDISFFTTRVNKPCRGDWRKVEKILNF